MHATQRVEHFGNIFAPSNSSGTRTLCANIVGGESRGSRGSCKLNTRGMKNWRFSSNASLYFENSMRSIELCHFQ